MGKQAKTKRRECNLEKVRECQRQDFLKYKEANPEKVKQMWKEVKTKRREQELELGIFIDKDSEFLSFPSIFCGKRRADNSERLVPVHYSTICKWELRSQDRRVAQSVPNGDGQNTDPQSMDYPNGLP